MIDYLPRGLKSELEIRLEENDRMSNTRRKKFSHKKCTAKGNKQYLQFREAGKLQCPPGKDAQRGAQTDK